MMLAKQNEAAYYAAIDEKRRVYNQRLCFVPDGVDLPGHPCVGANRVFDFDGFFRIPEIFDYIEEARLEPRTVAFSEIWHQIHHAGEMDHDVRQADPRYRSADTAFPGILAAIKNPENKPYRMLDGRRRMWKLQEAGETEGLFHVIPVPEVYGFFWRAMPISALRQLVQQY